MSTIINVRVERGVKEEAAKILARMGMNTSTAVNLLLYQIIQDKKFPFVPQITPPKSPRSVSSRIRGKQK